ncbi:MAG: amidohydrolase family protein [Gemmatimonadales bacterium]|nr:amidohydrolase family protein [Gemmatimonadales bacterium]
MLLVPSLALLPAASLALGVGGSVPDQAPPDSAPVTAIERVHVIPMTSDTVLRDRIVVIRNGRIAAICRATERCVPAGAARIDGGRRYLMPALADMHNHFGGYAFDGTDAGRIRMRNQSLRQYLMFGVMTARDPAGGPRALEARDAIARGELMGPRMFASPGVMDGDPPLFPGPRTFATPAAAASFVREAAANRYDLVKVYSTLSPAVFDTVMATAREVGLTVAAHVPMAVPLEHALERGLRSIEHLTGYDVACAAPTVTMRPVSTDIYQGWAWCTPEKIRALAELTARYRVWNVPTLALWDNTVIEVDRPRRAAGEPGQWEHPTMAAAIDWLYDLYGPRERAGITGTRSARLALVKALSDAGAPLLVGTDVSGAGYTVHQEMALFVEAGLTPYQALVAATREPARYLGLEGDFGIVAPGARADLVLLDANPLEDIRHSRTIRGLLIRGRWWTRAAIDAELAAIRREYAEDAATLRLNRPPPAPR